MVSRFNSINSAVYSTYYSFAGSRNYLVIYGKKIDLLRPCRGSLTFNATSESFKKNDDLENYISINYALD